jgi:hypothetical protein
VVAIVDVKPGEGDSVGEGAVLVASSPEEDTRADTLVVDDSDIGKVMIELTEEEAVTET